MEGPVKKASSGQLAMPFQAKLVTYRPESLLKAGEMSVCQNLRNMFPGVRKRRGLSLLDYLIFSNTIYDYCSGGVAKSVGFVATNASWGDINLYAGVGDILTVTTEPVNVSAYQLADGFTIERSLFIFSAQANPYYYNEAIISVKPSIYADTPPIEKPMPRICLLYLTTGKALSAPYVDDDYNRISDAIFAGQLASDTIIDTADLANGAYASFFLNAVGVKHLNDHRAVGQVQEFAIVEYDHDYLRDEPQIETYDDDADEETPEVEISQQWAMHEADGAGCGSPDNFPQISVGDGGGFYPSQALFLIFQFVKTHSENETGMPFATPGFIERHTLLVSRRSYVYGVDAEPPAPTVAWPTSTAVLNAGDGNIELQIRPSVSSLGHWLLYSDGQVQHKLWTGDRAKIKGCFLCTGSSFIGSDIFREVFDDMDATEATVTGLGSTDAGLMICTQTPALRFHYVKGVTAQSTNSRLATVQYYTYGTGWQSSTISSDTTITATNRSFGQTGTISFTNTFAETPVSFFGISGYWYRIRPGVSDFSSFTIARLEYSSNIWHPIENVWDGLLIDIIEAQVFRGGADTSYSSYSAESINISELVYTSAFIYFSTIDQVRSFVVDVGATQNLNSASDIASIHVWTGGAWSASSFTDGTNGFKNSGEIEITTNTVPEPLRFNDAQLATFWYRITLASTISENCIISVQYVPKFNSIDLDFGSVGLCSTAWKNRACLVFDRFPSDIYVSAGGLPNVLNGSDFTILNAGDGRKNKIVCMKKFHNELMTWQEERGQDGGTLTLFEGYSPATFGKLVLSSKVGTLNQDSAVVVDGAAAQTTRRDDVIQTKAYWISHYGAYESDGRTVRRISDDIQNFFDQRNPECIRRGFEKEAWVQYDSSDNVVRFGFVSGRFSEFCNFFPVYDITSGTWSVDEYHPRDRVVSMTEVDAASGDIQVLQIGVSMDEYFIMNTGLGDPSDSIDCRARIQINSGGALQDLTEVWVRMKVNEGATCSFNVYENGLLNTEHSEDILMSALEAGDTTIRERLIKAAIQEPNIAFEFRNDDSGSDFFLYDFIAHYKILADR